MARIFITGSADGLGQLTAKLLTDQGHQVVVHARNEARGREALHHVPLAEAVVTADLSSMYETKELATKVNALGAFDAVIHNAGVYQATGQTILNVNTLAPYILTAMIKKPKRLIYLSSGMHLQGHADLENFVNDRNQISYSDSKLHVVMLSMIVAARWPEIFSNAVDPGWVPTKMGGKGAPDDLQKGYETQAWLAVSNEAGAKVSGRYFYHKEERRCHAKAKEATLQQQFLAQCEAATGVSFSN